MTPQKSAMPLISVVIPVYKAEECMRELYSRLVANLTAISKDYEIVLVEDCGKDRSWELIDEICRNDPKVVGIKLSRNFGQHYALTAGLDLCNAEWTVVMDCDLQDRPEEIVTLYRKALEGFDIVVGRRMLRQDPLFKRATSGLFYLVFSYLSGMAYDGSVGNFRIMSRKVVLSYRQFHERLRFFGALVQWMGFSTASVDISHGERFAGQTSYTYKKLFSLAVDTVIAYSDKPLRIVVGVGFCMSSLSVLGGVFFLIQAIRGTTTVLGWASIVVSLYFIGGIIIGILGILGIYLGKTKKRPLYLISEARNVDRH
jgi:glycosyltransferase involved in cell wall biosynthesis